MFGFLKKLFGEQPYAKLSQTQNEALVEALASAVMIDGDADERELQELTKVFGMLRWQSSMSTPESYLHDSFARVQELSARGVDALQPMLQDIANRLEEPWLLEDVYYAAALVTSADHDIQESERALLNLFIQEFQIPRDRLEVLTRKLIERTTF